MTSRGDALAAQILQGGRSHHRRGRKYRQLDYEALKEQARASDRAVSARAGRVKALQAKSKAKQETRLMQAHSRLWIRQHIALEKERMQQERELEMLLEGWERHESDHDNGRRSQVMAEDKMGEQGKKGEKEGDGAAAMKAEVFGHNEGRQDKEKSGCAMARGKEQSPNPFVDDQNKNYNLALLAQEWRDSRMRTEDAIAAIVVQVYDARESVAHSARHQERAREHLKRLHALLGRGTSRLAQQCRKLRADVATIDTAHRLVRLADALNPWGSGGAALCELAIEASTGGGEGDRNQALAAAEAAVVNEDEEVETVGEEGEADIMVAVSEKGNKHRGGDAAAGSAAGDGTGPSVPMTIMVRTPTGGNGTGAGDSDEAKLSAIIEDCEDAQLRADLYDMLARHRSQHRERLTDLARVFSDVLRTPFDGWDPGHHARFLAVTTTCSAHRKAVEVTASGLSGNKFCLDALQRQFPDCTPTMLLDHQRWVTALRFCLRKRRELRATCAREASELLHHARQAIREANTVRERRMAAAATREALQEVRLQLTERLLELKRARLEELREREMRAAREAVQNEEVRAREARRQALLRAKAKREIERFRKHRRAVADNAREASEAAEHAARERDRQAAPARVERIGYRRELEHTRAQRRQQERQHARQEAAEREARLDALRETVRVEAPADEARLHGDTQATRVAAREGRAARDRARAHSGRIRQHVRAAPPGYSDKAITSDRRYRVEAALREAGLFGTDYARDIMRAVPANRAARRDAQTTLLRPDGGMTLR